MHLIVQECSAPLLTHAGARFGAEKGRVNARASLPKRREATMLPTREQRRAGSFPEEQRSHGLLLVGDAVAQCCWPEQEVRIATAQ